MKEESLREKVKASSLSKHDYFSVCNKIGTNFYCRTKEDDPRTICWKVVVPFRFKAVMENDESYPEGWRHRKFFGGRKKPEQNKQPRVEDIRVREAEQELERERVVLQARQEKERAGQMQEENKCKEQVIDAGQRQAENESEQVIKSPVNSVESNGLTASFVFKNLQ